MARCAYHWLLRPCSPHYAAEHELDQSLEVLSAHIQMTLRQVWVNALSKSSDTNVAKKPVAGKILLQDNDLIEIGQRQFIFHRNFDAPGSAKVCILPASF